MGIFFVRKLSWYKLKSTPSFKVQVRLLQAKGKKYPNF